MYYLNQKAGENIKFEEGPRTCGDGGDSNSVKEGFVYMFLSLFVAVFSA